MSQVPSTGSTGSTGTDTSTSTGKSKGNALTDVDVGQFLNLMIAELQNQDPLNPMDNAAMIEQIGQLRSITSTDKLINTLDSVTMGQNLTTAGAMIGKKVHALTDDSKDITGVVDSVSIETSGKNNNERSLKLHIGDDVVDVKNIREVLPE
jgi:flagellar basal-body rod modification protein FlgD